MLCWFYARCNRTHTFQIVQLLSYQSTEYLPKSLWDNQDIFWQIWDESLWGFFGQHSPMDAVFAQSLSYCWIMNTDLNWGKWGMQFFRCCSGFFYDLLDESNHLKTAFCIDLHYLCVILKFVWWSESFKCDKYAKNKKNRKRAKTFSRHCRLKHVYIV